MKRKYGAAAKAIDNAIKKYFPLTEGGDFFDAKKCLDFGTVTIHCIDCHASFWIAFKNKQLVVFELASLFPVHWRHTSRPSNLYTTEELLTIASKWMEGVKWIESQKDKEVMK